ncbi:MAG: Zn-ribbon domain-containing OB-fold protein [Proteobacteria bacterium]|nr:Zn-ribbon domain-containing OB-fold protein [Pseudomonadota bacterium]
MYTLNKKGHAIMEVEASIPYESATGPTWWRYFEEFKNEKIFGTRCPSCERVLVPARSFCPDCFVEMGEWVELAGEGEVTGWSLTNFHYFGMPVPPPYISAQILLDGTNCDFYHMVGGFDLSDLDLVRKTMKIGTRVKAVWKPEKKGCILDILHFKPVGLE